MFLCLACVMCFFYTYDTGKAMAGIWRLLRALRIRYGLIKS